MSFFRCPVCDEQVSGPAVAWQKMYSVHVDACGSKMRARAAQLEEAIRRIRRCLSVVLSQSPGREFSLNDEVAALDAALSTPPTDYLDAIRREAAAEALESASVDLRDNERVLVAKQISEHMTLNTVRAILQERAAAIRRGE
jgi:hypothetical protein